MNRKSLIFLFFLFTCHILSAQVDWRDSVKTGWCVYSFQCADTAHLSSIRKSSPELIRWFVEWDRFDVKKKGKSLRGERLNSITPFLKVCAEKNVTIILQMWVKERLWEGDNNGGTQWAKGHKFTNYPANTDQSYGAFVRDLVALMKEQGISEKNIIIEGWNEPDLLWGVKDNNVNYHQPWKFMDKKGFSKWMGGSGEKWEALFKVLDVTNPEVSWGNGAVAMHKEHESWIKPTYEIENIDYIDIHYYLWSAKSAQQYCDSVVEIIERWDKYLPEGKEPKPFFIGEIARFSSGTLEQQTINTADAEMMREACKILYNKYGSRFFGVTAHGPIHHWKRKGWFEEDYEFNYEKD